MYLHGKMFAVIFLVIFFNTLTISSAKNYSVVLVGGHLADENAEIWGRIIELGGGVGKARFGVITAASADPCCSQDSSWVYYRDLLTSYGAAEVRQGEREGECVYVCI